MRKRDLLTPIGLTVGFVMLVFAIASGGNLADLDTFMDVPSVFIVVGGLIASLLISFKWEQIKITGRVIRESYIKTEDRLPELIQLFIRLSERARREGLLALENELEDVDDPFIKKGILLAVDGIEPKVIIDFAHTEDALQKTLEILRSFVKERIILVFGVYADMSENGTEKRYGMGRVAAEYADLSIVTLDNPKKHDIEQIMKETTSALQKNNGNYVAIPDREEAIRYAIQQSKKDDFILLAGKGHERTQVIGGKEISFSEKDIVLDEMKNKTF